MFTLNCQAINSGTHDEPEKNAADLHVESLTVEYFSNPKSIDSLYPRLAWKLHTNQRNVAQTAYQIQVSKTPGKFDGELVWDSQKQNASDSIHIVYQGEPLTSATRYDWRVRVWDQDGHVTGWSAPAFWEMGLLKPQDWQAQWIEANIQEDKAKSNPAHLLRKSFTLNKPVQSAKVYVTSHGLYEMYLNGKKVGEDLFTPGWTTYDKRLQYQTYEVTDYLTQGENALGAMLADGWYRGNLVFKNLRNGYGDTLGLLTQLVVTFQDGSQQVITSDDSWKANTGAIRMSEIYHGETYDGRMHPQGWDRAGFDDKSWSNVTVAAHPKNHLVAPQSPPVRAIEVIKPISLMTTPKGETVLDLGQNMVGYIQFKVKGKAGDKVVLRHAEVLDPDGNFYLDNIRLAMQQIDYTLKGDKEETYHPIFSFQGFRYVRIDEYPGDIDINDFEGIVVHSDLPSDNHFETSKPLVNQLQSNILWSQKGNFLDIPTDCPQRNERLGWTGDAQIFVRTAAFNMNVAGFFGKWLKDLAADQKPSGSVTHIVPDVIRDRAPFHGAAAWGDAAVIIPWSIYQIYADKRVLEVQYESMRKWVEFESRKAGNNFIWTGTPQFGDWLAFSTNKAAYPGATTGKDYVATAFYANSVNLMAKISTVLGKEIEAKKYAQQFEKIKIAFNREFVTQTTRVAENTQTAYALALQFGLLPEAKRQPAADRLASNVRARKHLTTGFVGTPHLAHALSDYGHLDVAYMLLNREHYPSWLYPVKQGATTIWERWDGIKPNGSFQDPKLNSFNHYAYGAIGEWMYRVMAGLEIDPQHPGYKHFLVQPKPGGGFTNVKLTHQTMFGEITINWEIKAGHFILDLHIPANTSSTVTLPNAALKDVTENGQTLSDLGFYQDAKQQDHNVTMTLGSGRYQFVYPYSVSKEAKK